MAVTEKSKRPRGTGSVFTKRGIFWVKFHDRGRVYRESTGLRGKDGQRAAQNILNRRAGERHSGKFRPDAEKLRVQDLRRIVLLDFELNERRSTRRMAQSFDHLEDFFRHTPLIDVPRKASAYVEARKQEGAAN